MFLLYVCRWPFCTGNKLLGIRVVPLESELEWPVSFPWVIHVASWAGAFVDGTLLLTLTLDTMPQALQVLLVFVAVLRRRGTRVGVRKRAASRCNTNHVRGKQSTWEVRSKHWLDKLWLESFDCDNCRYFFILIELLKFGMFHLFCCDSI